MKNIDIKKYLKIISNHLKNKIEIRINGEQITL